MAEYNEVSVTIEMIVSMDSFNDSFWYTSAVLTWVLTFMTVSLIQWKNLLDKKTFFNNIKKVSFYE